MIYEELLTIFLAGANAEIASPDANSIPIPSGEYQHIVMHVILVSP
jgi:hypothetical protein